jgi:hypothetical protein
MTKLELLHYLLPKVRKGKKRGQTKYKKINDKISWLWCLNKEINEK